MDLSVLHATNDPIALRDAARALLAQVMAEFKRRAAAASQPQDMWAVETYLSKAGRDINAKYDYRYSVLEFVFARLLREGRIEDSELHGLSDERLERTRRIAAL